MSDGDGEKPPDRRLAIGLAAAAAVLLIVAAFTRMWIVGRGPDSRRMELEMGLRSLKICADSGRLARTGYSGATTCVELSNSELVKMMRDADPYSANRFSEETPSNVFVPAGWVTLCALLVAAAGLAGAVAFAALRRKPPSALPPTALALLGIMIGMVSACAFVATRPGPGGSAGVGLSFWAFGIGSVLGIAGAQQLAKLNRMV